MALLLFNIFLKAAGGFPVKKHEQEKIGFRFILVQHSLLPAQPGLATILSGLVIGAVGVKPWQSAGHQIWGWNFK